MFTTEYCLARVHNAFCKYDGDCYEYGIFDTICVSGLCMCAQGFHYDFRTRYCKKEQRGVKPKYETLPFRANISKAAIEELHATQDDEILTTVFDVGMFSAWMILAAAVVV